MTNNINNVPMYSMGLYMCVENPNNNMSPPPPHIHNNIAKKTKHLLTNMTYNHIDSDSKNGTNFTILDYDMPMSHIVNKTINITNITTDKHLFTTTPAPTTTPGLTTTPAPTTISSSTPSVLNTMTTTSLPVIPIDPSEIVETSPSENNNTSSEENTKKNDTQSPLIITVIILGSIIGLIICATGLHCILKFKKCENLLRKTIPEQAQNEKVNKIDENINKIDEMEKAKVKKIESKSETLLRQKQQLKKSRFQDRKNNNSWSNIRNGSKAVNAFKGNNSRLIHNIVPKNKAVRETVRQEFLKQQKKMPNGENNIRIKEIIGKLDAADKAEEENQKSSAPPLPTPKFN